MRNLKSSEFQSRGPTFVCLSFLLVNDVLLPACHCLKIKTHLLSHFSFDKIRAHFLYFFLVSRRQTSTFFFKKIRVNFFVQYFWWKGDKSLHFSSKKSIRTSCMFFLVKRTLSCTLFFLKRTNFLHDFPGEKKTNSSVFSLKNQNEFSVWISH